MVSKPTDDTSRGSWLYNRDFPERWKRQTLYSLATWVNGLAFRNSQFSAKGMPIIKISEIKGGISGQTKFTQQTFDDSVRVTPGDMLFSWSGQPETSIDVFWWHGSEGWLNQHVFRVTPVEGLDRTFFYYLLRYLKPNFIGIARNKQTTGLGHVTKRDLENTEVAYPRIPEQRAIAYVLGTLDDKIELNRRMNETLEAMARAIFKSWFVDFDPVIDNALRAGNPIPDALADRAGARQEAFEAGEPVLPSEAVAKEGLFPDAFQESDLGPIPAGWRAGTVNNCFNLTMGQSPPGSTYNEEGDGMPFYQGRTDFGLRFPSRRVYCTEPKRIAEKGDTLVSVRAPVGDVNMAWEECCVGRGVAAIRHESGSRSYTYYAMKGLGDKFERFNAEGTVFGSIGKRDFLRLDWVVPDGDAVEAYERTASPLDGRITSNELQSRTLAAIRDALLPKLLSGEVRVPEVERFVENSL